jgi:hypothetical protein
MATILQHRRMPRVLLGIFLIGEAGCFRAAVSSSNPALEVELVATRNALSSYHPAVLSVDSVYAQAGHAPPLMTDRGRPARRQRAFNDSLRRDVERVGGDTLRVRASEPMIKGRTATISVTIDGTLAGGRPGAFYETVTFVLDHDGKQWIVRERKQLGIS